MKFLGLIILAIAFVGCSRSTNKDSSRLTIVAPDVYGKTVGAFTLPTGRKACYAVNVTASDIPNSGGACLPPRGIMTGFVESGQQIEVTVKRGEGRKVDLLVYLKVAGDAGPCPSTIESIPGPDLVNLYKIGTVQNVNLSQDVQTLEITAVFPGLAQNIVVENSLPATCIAGTSPPPTTTPSTQPSGVKILSGAGVMMGSGMILKAKVGSPVAGNELVGSGLKLKVK